MTPPLQRGTRHGPIPTLTWERQRNRGTQLTRSATQPTWSATQPARSWRSGYEVVHAAGNSGRSGGASALSSCRSSVLFIGWYFLFVMVAVFAPGFMRISVFGDVNVGLCFGVLQFVSTFGITVGYHRWARRRLRPDVRAGCGSGWTQAGDGDHDGRGRPLAAEVVGRPAVNVAIFAFFVLVTLVIAVRAAGKNRTTTDYYAAGGPSPAGRTASRSAATTCRPRHSSVSRASSPWTATTASCTPSASWWAGCSCCCWSPGRCGTPAGTPRPTSSTCGCTPFRCAPPRPSPP